MKPDVTVREWVRRAAARPVATMPDSQGSAIVGYVFDAIGQQQARFAGDSDAQLRAAMADVNFDTMPPGWFIVVRKAPRP